MESTEQRSWLPEPPALSRLLALKFGDATVNGLLQSHVVEPVQDLLSRPSKRFRANLVSLGYAITAELEQANAHCDEVSAERQRRACMEVIEMLHAGSLIVDDIEDRSLTRRGGPSLHIKYGVPAALNAGNWLYFWALNIFKELGLPPDRELTLYRISNENLIRAHCGQALDLGVRIAEAEQQKVPAICLSSLELKSGSVTAAALVTGAIIRGASWELIGGFDRFGRGLGIALQMFNDIGNFSGRAEPEKRLEDLIASRPSWIWATAARHLDVRAYAAFVQAVNKLPAELDALERLVEGFGLLAQARKDATGHLVQIGHELRRSLILLHGDQARRLIRGPLFEQLDNLAEALTHAYL